MQHHSPSGHRDLSRPRVFVTRGMLALLLVVSLAVASGVYRSRSNNTTAHAAARTHSNAPDGFAELALRDTQIVVWHHALDADTGSALVLGQLAALYLQRAREGGGWADYLVADSLARHSLARRTHRNGSTAVTLVNSLLAQHRFTDARAIAKDLVGREGDIPEYRALLGEVSMELGDDALADSMYRSVWEQRLQPSMAPRVARWLELTNHVDDARRLLTFSRDQVVATRTVASETRAWFNLRLGDLELRAGNTRRARAEYEAGLGIEPGDPRLFSAMARLAMAERDPKDAVTWGERAIGLQLDPATLGLVGDAYTMLGDTAKANTYFETLDVAVASQPGAYHRAWALSLLDHGLRVDTVVAKAAAELEDRKDIYGYDVMAWSLFKAGRLAESHAMMDRAMRFHTPDPLLVRHAQAIDRAMKSAHVVAVGTR